MKARQILHLKVVLKHRDQIRWAIFEFVIWEVPRSHAYPEGVKYRAWLAEDGDTVFGFDNHHPKGPHLHLGRLEVKYLFRGVDALKEDILNRIHEEGFLYEE